MKASKNYKSCFKQVIKPLHHLTPQNIDFSKLEVDFQVSKLEVDFQVSKLEVDFQVSKLEVEFWFHSPPQCILGHM